MLVRKKVVLDWLYPRRRMIQSLDRQWATSSSARMALWALEGGIKNFLRLLCWFAHAVLCDCMTSGRHRSKERKCVYVFRLCFPFLLVILRRSGLANARNAAIIRGRHAIVRSCGRAVVRSCGRAVVYAQA